MMELNSFVQQKYENPEPDVQQVIDQVPEDPNMTLLIEVRDRLTGEQFDWYEGKVTEADKKTLMLFKCYRMTKDIDDLINSMQRLFNKAKK